MSNLIVIAASNSTAANKDKADYICSGKNDETVINKAIEKLDKGGTVKLLDGDYFVDSFPNEGNSAIFFGYNEGNARVVNIVGDTENKAYNTRFGVSIHVSETAFRSMRAGETYRVFYGTPCKPDMPPDFYTYTHVNNANLENFYLFLKNASHPVIGIDCINFGSAYIRQVGVFTEQYFEDRFLHLKPAPPCPGCIGINSCPGSNDEMARIRYDTVDVGGLYIGYQLNGVDHLVMTVCTAARCCYGYVFTSSAKTISMINCADEGNTHLPRFIGTGQLTNIDFNIERFNAAFIPDDIAGGLPKATEERPGRWHGFISYTLQGKAFGVDKFWEDGHGQNFRTVNLLHSLIERPQSPEFLETYFDIATNLTLTWNGTNWVDAMGHVTN